MASYYHNDLNKDFENLNYGLSVIKYKGQKLSDINTNKNRITLNNVGDLVDKSNEALVWLEAP